MTNNYDYDYSTGEKLMTMTNNHIYSLITNH